MKNLSIGILFLISIALGIGLYQTNQKLKSNFDMMNKKLENALDTIKDNENGLIGMRALVPSLLQKVISESNRIDSCFDIVDENSDKIDELLIFKRVALNDIIKTKKIVRISVSAMNDVMNSLERKIDNINAILEISQNGLDNKIDEIEKLLGMKKTLFDSGNRIDESMNIMKNDIRYHDIDINQLKRDMDNLKFQLKIY